MALVLHLPGGDNEASTRIKAIVSADAALINSGNTSASLAVGPKVSLPQATSLDGVNDYIACADSPWVAPTGPFAVGGWFYSANWKTGSSYGELAAKTNATSANTAFELRVNYVAGTPELVIYTSTGGLQSASAADISSLNATWVHIVGVYDGAFLRLYINGAASGTPVAKTGTPATTSEVVTIGIRNATSPSLPFVGRWCDFRIYNTSLTATEVLAWYAETTPLDTAVIAAAVEAALMDLTTDVNNLISAVAGVAVDVTTVESKIDIIDANVDVLPEAVFKLDLSTLTGEASRSLLNSIRSLRNKWTISGATLTVYKEDDSTPAWTSTISAGAANQITGNDPS